MDQFLMYFKIMLEGKFKVFYILEDSSDKAKIVTFLTIFYPYSFLHKWSTTNLHYYKFFSQFIKLPDHEFLLQYYYYLFSSFSAKEKTMIHHAMHIIEVQLVPGINQNCYMK